MINLLPHWSKENFYILAKEKTDKKDGIKATIVTEEN